ncbi:hypothetical protein ACFOSC_18490 [Streptantibioticus rubrisoli]|uniref:Uncharacterized protein n=1 Tax=Streptantibioticus rubrisoli TaxID=1387313 RepID=A0ABT1PDZ7_9ACTN|nr:hypothetical protein [Streptantibioticus rubrisoli]MCQ4043600.1 hypothetical protein [Streptantibioticus rubrisoli]
MKDVTPEPESGSDFDIDFDGVFDSTAQLVSLVSRQLSAQLTRIAPPSRRTAATAEARPAA